MMQTITVRPEQNDDCELLAAAIKASGLSSGAFARDLMGRNDRTIRRWLAGAPIPPIAVRWLSAYLAARKE